MAKTLTDKEIKAASLAIAHAEADAMGGGDCDDERSDELMLGVQVLTLLLKKSISEATKRSK